MVKQKEEIIEIIVQLVASLSADEKQKVLDILLEKKEGLPISIFRSKLSGLETIVVYLKDIKGKSVAEIAQLLNRKKSTLYTTYHKEKEKFSGRLDASDESVVVPPGIFADRKYAVLESMVAYLKDEQKLSFAQISILLNKKYSTIRTVYVRYLKKNGSK